MSKLTILLSLQGKQSTAIGIKDICQGQNASESSVYTTHGHGQACENASLYISISLGELLKKNPAKSLQSMPL